MDRFTARLSRSMNVCGQPVAAVTQPKPQRVTWRDLQHQQDEFKRRFTIFQKNLEEANTLMRAVRIKAANLAATLSKPTAMKP